MSLIVFPIDVPAESRPATARPVPASPRGPMRPGGDEPGADPVEDTLLEVATHVALVEDGRRGADLPPMEPLRFALPGGCVDETRFRGPGRRFFVGMSSCEDGRPEGLPPGQPDHADLRDILEECLAHAGRSARTASGDGASAPMLVLMPVIRIPEIRPSERRADTLRAIDRALGAFWSHLDAVVPRVITGGLEGKVQLGQGSIRILPWVYAEEEIALSELLSAVRGPRLLGCPALTPIIYSDMSRGGRPHPFDTYGRSRLLTDILLVHALSSNTSDYMRVLESGGGHQTGSDEFLLMHSTLFEFPYDDLVRESVLRRMVGRALDERLIPDLDSVGELSVATRNEVAADVRTTTDVLREVLDRAEIEPDAFSFGPRKPPATPDATAPRSTPPIRLPRADSLDFDLKPAASAIRGMSVDRDADRLHTTFYKIVRDATGAPLETAMNIALEKARETFGSEAKTFEKKLDSLFDHRPGDATTVALTPPVRSMGRVLSAIDGVTDTLDAIERQNNAQEIETVEAVLETAMSFRGAWVDEEERLIQEAATLPGPPARILQSIGVGTSLFLATMIVMTLREIFGGISAWQSWATSACVAAVAVMVTLWLQQERIAAYIRQWESFERSMQDSANEIGRSLVTILNHRIRCIKMAAANDLRRSLATAKARFVTEISGLSGIVTDELAVRSSRARERQRRGEIPADQLGRYRVEPKDDLGADGVSPQTFHQELRTCLDGVVKLTEMPERVTLDGHQRLIQAMVGHGLQFVSGKMPQADAVRTVLESAVRHGIDVQELPAFPGQAGPPRHFFLASPVLDSRTTMHEAVQKVSGGIDQIPIERPAARNLAGETAIVLTIAHGWVKQAGGQSKPAG